jgi:hypothetical protein
MADIAKCNDVHCPSKEYCYRFTAPASEVWQSYGVFSREEDADNCDMFWANGKESKKCKLNGVKRDGEICNLDYCTYPNCVQDDYCKYCHQTDGVHKMGCETRKVTMFYEQMEKEVHQNRSNLNE